MGRGDLSRGVSASPGIVFCAAVAGRGRTPDLDAFDSQTRGRLGFGLEQDPPAARDGLRSSRGAATARRDRAAAALGRWGWFGLRDCGFAVCHSARRKVGGREQGRVPGACERDCLWV